MPNKNYNRGRAAEYSVIAHLKKIGYNAHRSAGSHGCDIICWNVSADEQPLVKAIMVTLNNTKAKIKEDTDKLHSLCFHSIIAQEIWIKKKHGWYIHKVQDETNT